MINQEQKNKFLKYRQPIAWLLAILWAAFIFIISSLPASAFPEVNVLMSAFLHFTEYWILAVLLVGALNMPWRMSWLMAVFAMVIASLYGISDELHQLFVPGRMCSVTDWLVDTAGATVGGLAGTWVLALYRIYSKSSKATDFQPPQIPDDQLGKNQPSEGQKIN